MEQKTRIKGNVHYVGVNDRNKHLFEGMWPLPYGVSYNSYLIDDEMVALIDTVDICYFEVYLRKIRNIIGDRPINYLIINHMEPDHSGSIRYSCVYPRSRHPAYQNTRNHHRRRVCHLFRQMSSSFPASVPSESGKSAVYDVQERENHHP